MRYRRSWPAVDASIGLKPVVDGRPSSRQNHRVPLRVEIPGRLTLELEFLLLDVNGTLSDRGQLVDGVAQRLDALQPTLQVELLSADTFGTLAAIAARLDIVARKAASADEKLEVLRSLDPLRCVAVGNGANDALMLREAALGIGVIGSEGAASETVAAADVVCRSVVEALDLLLEPRALAATLRR